MGSWVFSVVPIFSKFTGGRRLSVECVCGRTHTYPGMDCLSMTDAPSMSPRSL